MTDHTILATMLAISAAPALLLASPVLADGPKSPLYVTMPEHEFVLRVTDSGYIVRGTETRDFECALFVNGSVRTVPPADGGVGSGYELLLQDNGKFYTNNLDYWDITDATTDGTHLYGVSYWTGEVFRARHNWDRQEVLFDIGSDEDYSGITYDPSNHSIWVCGWDRQVIENYDMQGNLLFSFDPGFNDMGSLALDHADGTLWVTTYGDVGTFYQFSKTGQPLGSITYVSMESATYGGEFDLGAAAKILRINILEGGHIKGTLKHAKNSDGKRYQVRSRPASGDKRIMECEVRFKTNVLDGAAMDIVVDSRINHAAGGTGKIFLKNHATGEFDLVDTHPVGSTEDRVTVYNLDPEDYVNENGKIVVRIRHMTNDPQAARWKSLFNVVQARVR